MPFSPEATRFSLLCRRSDYSAGRIAAAIEDCNTHVLNLNVTSDAPDSDSLIVDVRVDRNDISALARSLARYDYIVVDSDNADGIMDEKGRRRLAEFLRYLDV